MDGLFFFFFSIKKINLYCCYIHIFNIFLKLTSEKMRFSWLQQIPTGKPLSLRDLGTDQNGELNKGGEYLRSRQLAPAGQHGMGCTLVPSRAQLPDPLPGADLGSATHCCSTVAMKCVRACAL